MMKKLAESFTPLTNKISEVNESTKKLEEVFNKGVSENENQQEIVPVEIETDDENKDIRAPPNIAESSALLTDFRFFDEKSHFPKKRTR